MMFSQLGTRLNRELQKRVKCYISCESRAVEELIYDYYDNQPQETRLEIKLFNVPELRIRDMFAMHPVTKVVQERLEEISAGSQETRMKTFCEGAERFRQHVLIAGFGVIGQEALLQALNLCVVHSEAEILIDVIDDHMESRVNAFMSRFGQSYVKRQSHGAEDGEERSWEEYELKEPECDGRLRLRFFHEDIMGEGFSRLLWQLLEIPEDAWAKREQMARNPLTYAVVSITDPDISIHGMLEIRKCVARYQKQTRIPIGVRVDEDEYIAQFLNQNGRYEEVFPISLSENVVRIEQILNENVERMAIEYHDCYCQICGDSSRKKLWSYEKKAFS